MYNIKDIKLYNDRNKSTLLYSHRDIPPFWLTMLLKLGSSIILPYNCYLTQFQKHNRITGGLIRRHKFSNAANSSVCRAVSTRRSCFTVSQITSVRFDANKSGINDTRMINSLSVTNNPVIVHVMPLIPRG